MTAQLITRFKDITPDGAILEMVIWKVPEPVPPTDHGYKYRAVYVVSGIRFQGTLDLNCPASVGRLSMMHSLKMKGFEHHTGPAKDQLWRDFMPLNKAAENV